MMLHCVVLVAGWCSQVADYSLVADLFAAVPEFEAEVRKAKQG